MVEFLIHKIYLKKLKNYIKLNYLYQKKNLHQKKKQEKKKKVILLGEVKQDYLKKFK